MLRFQSLACIEVFCVGRSMTRCERSVGGRPDRWDLASTQAVSTPHSVFRDDTPRRTFRRVRFIVKPLVHAQLISDQAVGRRQSAGSRTASKERQLPAQINHAHHSATAELTRRTSFVGCGMQTLRHTPRPPKKPATQARIATESAPFIVACGQMYSCIRRPRARRGRGSTN